MQNNRIIQVEDKVPPRLLVPLSIQHMFAMFGASVLVPFIFKMNPAIVLFMNGIGTLLFILITKGKAPAYLGSSFAFIAPVSYTHLTLPRPSSSRTGATSTRSAASSQSARAAASSRSSSTNAARTG